MKKTIATFLNLSLWKQSFIAGIFLGSGFLFPNLWFLVFFGLGFFLYTVEKENSFKKIFLASLLTFSLKTLFSTTMFLDTYPIKVIDVDLGKWEFLVIVLYWFSVSVTIGLSGGFLALILKFSQKYLKKIYLVFLFPLLLVGFEILGSVFFSILTLGEASKINTVYSLGYVGYLLAEHNFFIKLAVFGGVYFLSFVTAFLSIIIFYFLKKEVQKPQFWPKKVLVFSLVLFLVVVSAKFNFNKNYQPVFKKTVAVVDVVFPVENSTKEEIEERLGIVEEIVAKTLELKTDYILLPEGANYNLQNFTPESAYNIFRFKYSDPKVILIDSSQAEWEKGVLSQRANIFDGINKQGLGIDKQLLTPQGEYLPYFYGFFVKKIGGKKAFLKLEKELSFRPGPLFNRFDLPQEVPAVLFCFESIDPYAAKRVLKGRESVPFIAHPISHIWFHNSKILSHTVDTMLKIQAIWNHVPIVSAGNLTSGALYTTSGQKIIPENKIEGESWRVGIITL